MSTIGIVLLSKHVSCNNRFSIPRFDSVWKQDRLSEKIKTIKIVFEICMDGICQSKIL